MQALLLYIDENVKFDLASVQEAFSDISINANVRSPALEAAMECDVAYSEDTTIVRLSEDLETISIHGTGPASVYTVLEIQKKTRHGNAIN